MSGRRTPLILVALVLAALAGVAALAVPGSPIYQKPTLGLDLQGGLEVVLEAVPPEGRPLREGDLNRSVTIIRDRIDKLGVAEPEVRKQGENQISVELPGVQDAERASSIIGQTAKLALFDLEADLTGPSIAGVQGQPVAHGRLFDLLAGVQSQTRRGKAESYHLFRTKTKRLVAGPMATRAALLEKRDGKVPKGHKVFALPRETIVITCAADAVVCPGVQEEPSQTYFYLFKYRPEAEDPIPEMTGEDLRLQGTRQDFDTTGGGGPIVLMQFTDDGGDKFQEITRDLYARGRLRNSPQHFAIVLDREIKSWPQIDYTDSSLAGGIGGGSAQITGLESIREAKDIALVLQTGALPVDFRTLSETKVSATLGEDSLREALRAAIAGMLIVALFLLLFYRFLGLVAVLGLGIYAAFLYAIILLFDVTLTLPGFAGMILTIGVAADANIVIFERIKEESRAGKSVRAAISAGYAKGFATIVDANVVTAITAVILFLVATAGVRGFAFLLLLGTGISVVTAVFATRALLALLGGLKWFDNPAFMGATPREIPRWQRLDIVGRRRIWFSIASVLILLSIAAIAVRGLNLGIDFKGGTQMSFTAPRPVAIEDVRVEAGRIGQEAAIVQGLGEEAPGGGYRQFQIKSRTLEPAEEGRLISLVERRFDANSRGARTVSASFSEEILRGAIYALIFSFILITIYITLRFQWRFAVPILRTIANDGLIALGIYAVAGKEVSAATVAAFLTIIGYSIYDTIIIFDRVRENLGLMRRDTVSHITNVSLWETIPRSLATTFITLLPVSALYFFGGETLKDFAFAILVGIGISAFSTIFIGAPFLSVLLERVPEYRRRKEAASGRAAPESTPALEAATAAAAAEPAATPELVPLPGRERAAAEAKRERRRQRRRSRPHGRAR